MPESTRNNIHQSKSSSIKKQPFHVVAIGASAGGMDPLISFFKNMPSDTGMAFIVVQHLSSDFKSLMGEILVHSTSMPIHTVEEGMSIQSNTIYLLPPNHTMTIKKDCFHLEPKNKDEQIHYPIDILFESLATAYKTKAIAVVLSGSGTDGSRGIVKIAEAGGLVLVESTHEAQFIGMPQSAIATEVADYIAQVNELPDIIIQYANDPLAFKPTVSEHDLHYSPEYEQLFKLLHNHYNLDFSHYKISTVFRRIDRRIQTLKLHTMQAYLEYLQIQPEELALLYKDLLIGVTLFFRDQAAFDLLEKNVIPVLFEKQQQTHEDIRVWCAACSTGEEAYSLAILFFEYAEKNNLPLNIKIFATDISVDLMNIASIGIYSKDAIQYISQKRLERYFTREGEQYKITPAIREMIIFVPHNLLTSPPFIKMDLISCRNFLIYVQPLIQKKILSLLHLGLNPNGFLFLGPSENIGELTPFVKAISTTWKIYKKTNALPSHLLFNQNGSPTFSNTSNPISAIKRLITGPITSYMPKVTGSSLPVYAYQALIKQFIPCGFILDEYFNVLHILGNAGDYISHEEGVAKLDIISMISTKLKMPLNEALHRTKKNKHAMTYANITY